MREDEHGGQASRLSLSRGLTNMREDDLYRDLLATETRIGLPDTQRLKPVTDYIRLVRDGTWRQVWNPGTRKIGKSRRMTGKIWSDAIERCLKEAGAVFIPRLDAPVYLDRPIVLRSGNRLVVDPATEIRLIIGDAGTCMVRNASVRFAPDRPIVQSEGADTDILIEGGIWSDQNNEGRGRGGTYDGKGSMPGTCGVFLLHNVSGVAVRNVRFRDCSPFAVHIGNATDFILDKIRFDETADGIHVEGPASRGIIRNVAGKTNDDAVALNAWDWDNSSITFGPITDVLVEDVELTPGYTWSELRIFPGTKVFASGATLDCDIRRCVFRNIRGVHTFKMYDQPNIAKPEADFANPIGKLADLFFADIVVDGIRKSDYYDKSSAAVFDICADVERLSIRNVRFNYIPGEADLAPGLVAVGPKSLTWRKKPSADSGSCWRPTPAEKSMDEWIEVFNPNANPVVTGLTIKDIQVPDPQHPGSYIACDDPARLILERCLTLNPDFPNTMPRGGTGRGRVIDPVID